MGVFLPTFNLKSIMLVLFLSLLILDIYYHSLGSKGITVSKYKAQYLDTLRIFGSYSNKMRHIWIPICDFVPCIRIRGEVFGYVRVFCARYSDMDKGIQILIFVFCVSYSNKWVGYLDTLFATLCLVIGYRLWYSNISLSFGLLYLNGCPHIQICSFR